MNNKINSPEYINKLVPYKSGNSTNNNISRDEFKTFINLASNENPHGTSPKAVESITNAIKEISIYPDVKSTKLVNKLANMMDISPDEIICGHGSDSLIGYIINAFSDLGDEILTAKGTFIGAYVNTNKLGRKLTTIPLVNYSFDLSNLLKSITEKTKIIYLANPNNPTGSMFSKEEFLNFFAQVPKNILVLLDEAYFSYCNDFSEYPNGLQIFKELSKEEKSNLIIIRTLSKHLGLAGLRVGYAFGDEDLINVLYKVKLPFEPNLLAQEGAVGGLDDDEYIIKAMQSNKICIKLLVDTFKSIGIEYVEPKANFVMILLKTDLQAQKFVELCLQKKVVVRYLAGFGINNGVRISTGTEEQTKFACGIFKEVFDLVKYIL